MSCYTVSPDNTTICDACGKTETADVKLMACSRCKKSYYCSKDCQVRWWPTHKKYCKQATAKDYKVKASSKSKQLDKNILEDLKSTVGVDCDVRTDKYGKVTCQFTVSRTEDTPFLYQLIENAHVDIKGKYGFDPLHGSVVDNCPLMDQSTPTDDVPKLIMQSIIVTTSGDGVIVLSEEDEKYHLMMRNGRKYIKMIPPNITESMSSVIRVEFCMANSNVKIMQFLGTPDSYQVLLAKDKATIASVKRHLEKNATKTDKELFCIRGRSQIFEGYLDMQNLD